MRGNTHVQRGFTSVELVVAIAFAAILVSSIMMVHTAVSRLNHNSRHLLAASQITQSQIQTYENMDFDSIPSGPPESPLTIDFSDKLPDTLHAPRTGTLFITEKGPTLKFIKAVVIFQGDDGVRRIEHAVIVGKHSAGQ